MNMLADIPAATEEVACVKITARVKKVDEVRSLDTDTVARASGMIGHDDFNRRGEVGIPDAASKLAHLSHGSVFQLIRENADKRFPDADAGVRRTYSLGRPFASQRR